MASLPASHDRPPADGSPAYRRVKDHVLGHILAGDWSTGERIPSEHELKKQFGVSRMTVHRAIRELTDEGYLSRTVGAGTFVVDRGGAETTLVIRGIASAARDAGLTCRTTVIAASRGFASTDVAARLGLAAGAPTFWTMLVHWSRTAPIQYEERWVNASLAPDYLDHDFEREAPAAVLARAAPDATVEHEVRAVVAKGRIRTLLAMQAGEPCLLLTSRTKAGDAILSVADLYHPGDRYALPGRFI